MRLKLFLIFVLALILRTIWLSTLPNGVFTDEVVSGYVGRFILEHGKDIYGNTLPLLYFDKFGDYRVVLPMYLKGAATYIFGTSIFALRIVPAVFGALAVIPFFYVIYSLTKKESIAYLASFFLAITPWHILLSRAESEGIMGLTLFLFAMYLFLQPSYKKIYLGGILFFLTYFFYPAFRLTSPLIAWLFVLYPTQTSNKKPQIVVAILLTIITTAIIQTPFGGGRFNQTSFFANKDIAENINAINSNYAQAHGPGNARIAYLFHNRITAYTREFIINTASYLSPQFLFLFGGKPERYSVPSFGLLPIMFGFFMLWGLLEGKQYKRILILLFAFSFISILPASLTADDIPNTHRSLLLIIPLILLAAIGFNLLIQQKSILMKSITILSLVLLIVELILFWHHYLYLSPSYKSVLRGDGLWQGAQRLIELKPNYEHIYSTTFEDFPIYVLYQMNRFDSHFAGKFTHGSLYIPQLDTITFIPHPCPQPDDIEIKGATLLVVNGDCEMKLHEYDRELETIYRKDQTQALLFIEVTNQ